MRRGARLGALACVAVAAVGMARAEEPARPTIDSVRAGEARTSPRAYALGRVQVNYPQRLAGTIGMIVARIPREYDCTTTCLLRGLTVQASAGIGGGAAAIGYGSLVGEKGASRAFLRHPYVGWGARAAYVRTWGGASGNLGGAGYLGAESGMTLAQFSLTLGVFRRLPSDRPGGEWRVFGGAGWGF